MDRHGGLQKGWKVGALLALFIALAPGMADACSVPNVGPVNGSILGVLVETMESAPAHAAPGGTNPLAAGSFPAGQGVRIALAKEAGSLFLPCGTMVDLTGTVNVTAQSKVMLITDASGAPVISPVTNSPELGVGPISGSFTINAATGKKLNGKLDGLLDFRTLCGGSACPVVLAYGSWTSSGSQRAGGFMGVAYVPIDLGGGFWVYLDGDGSLGAVTGATGIPSPIPGVLQMIPLQAGEFTKFGSPMAKFLITLFE